MTKQKFEKMFPPPPEGKLLGFNVHSARYGTAEMFRLRPYQEKHPGTQKYGTIECEVSGEKNRYTGQPLVKRASVLVEILEPQIAEETAGMPGGINVRFFKRKDGWGVAFSANDIIAGRYLKLNDADMEHLMSAGGIILS